MFNKKILIVDDEILNRDLLADYLTRKGFKNVLTAAKADETLQKIKTEKPDLIILDIALEDYIDGVEILRRTKAGLSPNSYIELCCAGNGGDGFKPLGPAVTVPVDAIPALVEVVFPPGNPKIDDASNIRGTGYFKILVPLTLVVILFGSILCSTLKVI